MPLSAAGLFPEHPLNCMDLLQVGQPKTRQVGGATLFWHSIRLQIRPYFHLIRSHQDLSDEIMKVVHGWTYQARRREAVRRRSNKPPRLFSLSASTRRPHVSRILLEIFCKLEPPVGATFRFAASTAAVLLLPGLGMWREEGPRIR